MRMFHFRYFYDFYQVTYSEDVIESILMFVGDQQQPIELDLIQCPDEVQKIITEKVYNESPE